MILFSAMTLTCKVFLVYTNMPPNSDNDSSSSRHPIAHYYNPTDMPYQQQGKVTKYSDNIEQ